MPDEIKRLHDVIHLLLTESHESPALISIETDSLTVLEHTIRALLKQNPPSQEVYFLTIQESPYEPFLSFIKTMLESLPEEEQHACIEELSLSSLTRDLFHAWLFDQESTITPLYTWYFDRDEWIFFQNEIFKGLREALLLLYKKRPYLLFIRCTDRASLSFFDFLAWVKEEKKPLPPFALLMDTRMVSQLPEEQFVEWNHLFQQYQKGLYSFEFIFSDNVFEETSIRFASPSLENLFARLKTCERRWAWRDVKTIAETLLKQENALSLPQRVETLTLLALSMAVYGSIDQAIFAMERNLSLLQEYHDTSALLRSQILQAYFYLHKGNGRETALKIARHTAQLCPPGDKILWIITRGLVFSCGDLSAVEFESFSRALARLRRRFPLFYLFIASNYYFAMGIYALFPPETTIRHLKRDLSLARRHNHLYRQTFFLHHLAIVYSRIHNYTKTVRFYKKSIQLRQKLGDRRKISHAFNGFGYVYYAAENFHRAFFYYNKAMHLNIELRDYRELCMSLMNAVQLEIVLHNYATAEDLLALLIDLKTALGIESLPIHSNTKIITLHTYLLEKLNKFVPYYHQAREWIEKETNPESLPSHEEFAYLQWFLARYYQRYINRDRVIHAYETAIEFISRDEFNYTEMEIRYDYLMWLKENAPHLYENQKKRFVERLQSLNLYHYQNYLLEHQIRSPRHHYNLPRSHILETARLYAQLDQAQHTLETLDFMNQLQKILLRQKDKHTLIIEAMLLLKRYILVDFIVCYLGSYRDNYKHWHLIYSSHETKHIPADLYTNIRACFTTQQDRLIGNVSDHYMKLFFPDFHSLMYFPLLIEEQEAGCIFLANKKPENAFTEQVFRNVQAGIKQINTMLANIIYAEMLHHTAQTDILTGCANRFALQKRLEEEEERAKRSDTYNFSVVFTDMDNFKYYNDTFGHSVGDRILQEVALFLQKNVRKVDLVGRFGGDKFILILPDTNHHKAFLLIRRLYQKLKTMQFFEKMLSEHGSLIIPPEKHLSLSMGIADYRQAGNLQHLLEFADIALYEAKRKGKNKAIVYQA